MRTVESDFAELATRDARRTPIAERSITSVQEDSRMNRRAFLKVATAVPAMALPGLASLARAQQQPLGLAPLARPEQKPFAPWPGTWRTFEITTRVEVRRPSGVSRVWLPVPAVVADYQRPIENGWTSN